MGKQQVKPDRSYGKIADWWGKVFKKGWNGGTGQTPPPEFLKNSQPKVKSVKPSKPTYPR